GLERDRVAAHPAEEVVVRPTEEAVDVGLDRVELHAAAELHRVELRALHLDVHRDDRRSASGSREVGNDVDGAEDPEIEHGLPCGIEIGLRKLRTLVEIERAAHRIFGQITEALDDDLAEDGTRSGGYLEHDVRRAVHDVDERV